MPKQRMLLTSGLSLTLRNWRAFVWTYVLNVGLALLFSLPLHQQINDITAHSLASQRLTGAFDLGTAVGVTLRLSKGPGPATASSFFSIPFYLLLYFLIVPGTLFCYQTGTRARLFTLLESGLLHFWRFVRITLITLVVSVPILIGLNALQGLWSDHVHETTVGRPAFLMSLAGTVVIGLVAAVLRVYFDLVQVYTVQLGKIEFPLIPGKKGRPERQIRRAFKPAWRAFRRNFFRLYLSFVFVALLGLAAVALSAWGAMQSLAQPRVLPMFLLAQLGLFLMLFTRFWQRGAETVLVEDNPIPVPVPELIPVPVVVPVAVTPSAPVIPETPPTELAPEPVPEPEPIFEKEFGGHPEFGVPLPVEPELGEPLPVEPLPVEPLPIPPEEPLPFED